MRATRSTFIPAALGAIVVFGILGWTFPVASDALVVTGTDVVFKSHFAAGRGDLGTISPHHLLGHLLAWPLSRLGSTSVHEIAPRIRAYQFLAALATAVTALVVFRFLAARSGGLIALALALMTAFCAGPWLLAGVGENMPAASCALAALLLFIGARHLDGREIPWWSVSALFLLALLFRQDSIFAAASLFILLPWRRTLLVISTTGCAALGLYALAWSLSLSQLDFATWLVKLAHEGPWGHLPDARGLRAAGEQQMAAFIGRAGSDRTLQALVLVALGSSLFQLTRVKDARLRSFITALFVFVAARSAFGLWWEPANIEVWTPNVWPLLVIAGLLFGRASNRKVVGITLMILACGTAAWNLNEVIRPLRGSDFQDQVRTIEQAAGPQGRYVLLDFNLLAAFRREATSGRWVEDPALVPHIAVAMSNSEAPGLRSWVAARHAEGETVVFARDPDTGQPFAIDVLTRLAQIFDKRPRNTAAGEPLLLVLRP